MFTNYFRSEVNAKKPVENAVSDGFGWNLLRTVSVRITKFYIVIAVADYRPHKHAKYDATIAAVGQLQNAVKHCTKVHKTGPTGHKVEIIRPLFNLKSLTLAWTCMPT